MEGAHFIKTGKLVKLSEQQLVDCSFYNFGCRGGFLTTAFIYSEMYGIETAENYPTIPYTGYYGEKQKC
jgi:hypothetical protein